MKKFVCMDIGGTAIKYGLINECGEILCFEQKPTEAEKGGPFILDTVIHIIEEYQSKQRIHGICISTAGMVDVEKGEIFHAAPIIPNYTGIQYKAVLEQKFNVPCEVENDVNCAGLAEAISGAAKGCKVALILTVGTGIGGCIVMDGKVFHGFSGSACEVGYMYMDGSDFQTLGATSALTKKVAFMKNEPETKWNGLRVFDFAKAGDKICIQAIGELVEILGRGISNICYVINPEVIVLGGGIMAQEEYLKEKIESALNRWLIPSIASHTKFEFALHKNQAGMLGAFYHFMQRQSSNK